MGLDMFLKAERFFWYDEARPEVPEVPAGYDVRTITVEAGYWRKANHIHAWFVDHVQGGEDTCKNYPVDREDLAALLETCKAVLAEPGRASELLPTQSGFFFGSTDYNEFYFEEVRRTVAIIEDCLDESKFFLAKWDFEYHASW